MFDAEEALPKKRGLPGKNRRMHYESVIGNLGTEAEVIMSSRLAWFFTAPNCEDLSTATPGGGLVSGW